LSLVQSISEILDAAMRMQVDQGLLRNYLDDSTWFGETSGSALLASVAYRLSTLSFSLGPSSLSEANRQTYVAWAERIRLTFGTNGHITNNGTATPAVNPLGWGDHTPYTAGSPEGQNFVLLMYAAWRDCVIAGVPGCKTSEEI
jgi:rhamnogalacturonyl hydrolase YesR